MPIKDLKYSFLWLFELSIAVFISMAAVDFIRKQLVESTTAVTHTYRVMRNIDLAQTAILNAETGERGFIITDDRDFLTPYFNGISAFPLAINEIRQLTKDNVNQQDNVDKLEKAGAEKIKQLQICVDIMEKKGTEAAKASVLEMKAKQLMQHVRAASWAMQDEENKLLQTRLDKLQSDTQAMTIVLPLLILGSFTFQVIIYYFLKSFERDEEKKYQEVVREHLTHEQDGGRVEVDHVVVEPKRIPIT